MAKTEMKIAVNETTMIARTVSPLMGPTDFSLNAAACVQVTARPSSAFFSSSVLEWLDQRNASSAYSRNSSAFIIEALHP
jgi:hypothetical protein